MSPSPILITGGAGYIGSHTCVELITAGQTVLLLDNLSNSRIEVLNRIERITGVQPRFIEGDIRDGALLDRVFSEYPIQSVIHFAGLKAVGESIEKPLEYYENNVGGTLELLAAMRRHKARRLVFSSSATVYGDPHTVPILENFPLSVTNPYGRSKLMIEEILGDLAMAEADWRIARLRYFNPVGAHPSGLIGEDPNGIPNNLMPFIAQVAVGKRPELTVFGNDYPTPDGTGVRDYIHVLDLARGHLAALAALDRNEGLITVNLGTGKGYSVLDMVHAFERASGRRVPYRVAPRRSGDVARCYADPELAARLLGWRAERGIDAMCADTWRWQNLNPDGYSSTP